MLTKGTPYRWTYLLTYFKHYFKLSFQQIAYSTFCVVLDSAHKPVASALQMLVKMHFNHHTVNS